MMMKNFTLLLFIGLIFYGCEDSNINYIVHNLPNSFPIDRDYKWEYKRTEYVNKTDWENERNSDTTYFDTLHAGPSENHQYFYYGWGNPLLYSSIVKNDESVNHFISIGDYIGWLDYITMYEKPNLVSNYSSIFDTTGYFNIYNSFSSNRYIEIDTLDNIIKHSYVEIKTESEGYYEYYGESKKNLFGLEKAKFYYDVNGDGNYRYFMLEKLKEINFEAFRLERFKSKLNGKLNQIYE